MRGSLLLLDPGISFVITVLEIIIFNYNAKIKSNDLCRGISVKYF